jgi:hypothetical protein
VDGYVKREKLRFSRGKDTPERHAQYLSKMAAESGNRFRVFGNMTWTKEKGWLEEDLFALEKTFTLSPPSAGKLFFCQYGLGDFSGREVMMAIETHHYVVYRGELQESPYLKGFLRHGPR